MISLKSSVLVFYHWFELWVFPGIKKNTSVNRTYSSLNKRSLEIREMFIYILQLHFITLQLFIYTANFRVQSTICYVAQFSIVKFKFSVTDFYSKIFIFYKLIDFQHLSSSLFNISGQTHFCLDTLLGFWIGTSWH